MATPFELSRSALNPTGSLGDRAPLPQALPAQPENSPLGRHQVESLRGSLLWIVDMLDLGGLTEVEMVVVRELVQTCRSVADMLRSSRPGGSRGGERTDSAFRRVPLGSLLRMALGQVEADATCRGVDVRIQPVEGLWILGQTPLVQQLLESTLLQAIRASSPRGTVDVTCYSSHGNVIVTIADGGPGLSLQGVLRGCIRALRRDPSLTPLGDLVIALRELWTLLLKRGVYLDVEPRFDAGHLVHWVFPAADTVGSEPRDRGMYLAGPVS